MRPCRERSFDAAGESFHAASHDHMAKRNDSNGKETPDSAAQYIAAIAEELARLARRNGLRELGYILEMARIEAERLAND